MAPLTIAVAGCGIAGLSAALLLHRQGHKVCLFDQFDTPKPVGSGMMLQPTGIAVLDRLGFAQRAISLGAEIDGLWGLNQHGKMALGANYSDLGEAGCVGIGIHRAALFKLLHDAVRAESIPVMNGWQVASVRRSHRAIRLVKQNGDSSKAFDLVVDATGLHSALTNKPVEYLEFGALWANVDWPAGSEFNPRLLEQRYLDARKMAGMLPIGTGFNHGPQQAAFFWSIRGEDYSRWRAAPLDRWKEQVIRLWPGCIRILDQITHHDDLTFARYAHRTLHAPVADRLIHIGDAWHSASPQLGQGANMAMLDAWSLSRGLEQGSTVQEALRMAVKWRTDHVHLYQWVTAFFTPLFQSSRALPATIRDRVTAPFSRYWPARQIQTLLLSGMFGAPLQQLELSVPNYSALSEAAKIASRISPLDQSYSPTTRQTSCPDES